MTLTDFPTDTDIVYSYDNPCTNGKGRVCQVVDQSGTTTYTYSARGELVQEDRLVLGVNYTTGYQYDDNGNQKVLTYPSGRTVTYVYDNADQINTILTTPPGGVQQTVTSSISYYPYGDIESMTYVNGLVHTATYDLQYRTTGFQTGALQDITYVPDPNGNVQDIIDNLDPNKNQNFSYDVLDRLEGAAGPWGSLGWTYDNVGNRLTYTDGTGTTDYNYFTGTNRLQALTGAKTTTFSFDANGNTKTEEARQYIYNENSRLAEIVDDTTFCEYLYNADGQRVSKTVDGNTTLFHYDLDGHLIGESQGLLFREYFYLGNEPIGMVSATSSNYIHTDHLGTPALMTDSSGAVAWQLETRPYGDGVNITGSLTLNLRFPGQYHDDESKLSYNNYRYYYGDLGRYLKPDPVGLEYGVDLYAYARNNPLRFIDPYGLWVVCVGAGGSGALPVKGVVAVGGGGSFKYCSDGRGWSGWVKCWGGFAGVGAGAGGGVEVSIHPWSDGLCEFTNGGGFGGAGGFYGGWGASGAASTTGIDISIGGGFGGWGGGGTWGNCTFIDDYYQALCQCWLKDKHGPCPTRIQYEEKKAQGGCP
jgi:RHS repeat-associated protein